MSSFPTIRKRRNRQYKWWREILAEHHLQVSDLIWPCFVMEGEKKKEAIPTLPGVFRYSIDQLLVELENISKLGIKAIAPFPFIDISLKDNAGKEALNENNLICRAIKKIKQNFPDLGIICDVALDPYTSHGQDGIIIGNQIANDETNQILKQQALTLAVAGADIVAPSDMMDGRIKIIREHLSDNNYSHLPILAYSAKYASNLYSAFRDAVGSRNLLGKADKNTYQLNFHNSKEALAEIQLDIEEGADAVMVKPASYYLDIIYQAANSFDIPIFAYHTSGEYAMLAFAAENKVFDDLPKANYENLIAIKRAGATGILSYAAPMLATYIKQEN